MANTSGHTLEILVQAKDMATGVLNSINQAIAGVGKAAQDAAKQTVTSIVDVSGKADQLKVKLNEISQTLVEAGLAAVGMGTALSGGVGLAVKTASDFERSMTNVKAVLQSDFAGNLQGLNSAMEQLSTKARDIGATTRYSMMEAAEGMENLVKAGYKTEETLAAIEPVMNLARVAGMGLAEASESVVNMLTPFGLKAKDAASAANTLAVVANNTTSGLRDITEAMKYAAPAASQAGLSLNETAAAIGTLSESGIKGSMAGTAINAMLIRLVKPTAEAKNALRDLGVTLQKNADGSANAIGTFQALRDAQMNLAQSAQIFGIHHANSGLVLAKNATLLGELTDKTHTQTTALDDLTTTVRGTFESALKRLSSGFQAFAEAIGKPLLDPLKAVILTMVDGLKAVTDFARAHETLTKYIAGAVGTIGLVLGAFGTLSLALAGIIKVVEIIKGAWTTLIAAWERGILISTEVATKELAEAAARQKNATAALSEAEAVAAANRAKTGTSFGGGATTTAGQSWGATARAALPVAGTVAAFGGAAISDFSKWDEDLKGINSSMMNIVGIATMLPGPIAAIVAATAAWGAALYQVATNWKELSYWIAQDLGISGVIDSIGKALNSINPAAGAMEKADAILKQVNADIKQADAYIQSATTSTTDIERSWGRALADFGGNIGEFARDWKTKFGVEMPAAIKQGFDEAKRQLLGLTDHTKLTSEQVKELTEESKKLAQGLSKAFTVLKEQTTTTFTGINDGITQFEEQWQDTVRRTSKTTEESQNAFKVFAESASAGLSATATYVTEQMEMLANRLRLAVQANAMQPEIDACKKLLKDFADVGIKEVERLSKGWEKQLKDTYRSLDNVAKELSELDGKYQRQRVSDEEVANNAIRDLRRSTMTGIQQFNETLSVMQARKSMAAGLIDEGGMENLSKARELMLKNIQDAGQFRSTQVSGLSQQRAAEIGIREIQEAQERLQRISTGLQDQERQKLEQQKTTLDGQADSLQTLVDRARELVSAFQQKLNISVDVTAAEEQMKALFKDREINITANVTTTGDTVGESATGMATGGALPGYGGGDIVPAYLEPGEFVVRKESVRSIGLGALNYLNNLGGNFSSAIRSAVSTISIPHFASGGFVDDITSRISESLQGLNDALNQTIQTMRDFQSEIQRQNNAAYATGGGGSQMIQGDNDAFLNALEAKLQPFIEACGTYAQSMRETQRIEVNIQDGMSSTQTSVDY